jgi:hypothetical protein
MKEAQLIQERSFSVYFDLIKNQADTRINGEITFGGGESYCLSRVESHALTDDSSLLKP